MSDDRQEKIGKMLNDAINLAYSYVIKYSSRFDNMVDIYFENLRKLENIDNYVAKDH